MPVNEIPQVRIAPKKPCQHCGKPVMVGDRRCGWCRRKMYKERPCRIDSKPAD